MAETLVQDMVEQEAKDLVEGSRRAAERQGEISSKLLQLGSEVNDAAIRANGLRENGADTQGALYREASSESAKLIKKQTDAMMDKVYYGEKNESMADKAGMHYYRNQGAYEDMAIRDANAAGRPVTFGDTTYPAEGATSATPHEAIPSV